MSQTGKVRAWNDEKGFGFIEAGNGDKDVFLHISAFRNRSRRPEVGQIVTYTLSRDARGRPRASKAALPGSTSRRSGASNGGKGSFLLAAGFLSLVAAAVLFSIVPALILWGYLAVSMVTYLVYAYDKMAAKDGAWRTAEGTLHWMALMGGWPGALIAQQTLRHKSKKQSFRTMFWVTVVLNCVALVWLSSPAGESTVESLTKAWS